MRILLILAKVSLVCKLYILCLLIKSFSSMII